MNKTLYKKFTKQEMVQVCEELEVPASVMELSTTLSEKIIEDILKNGVPEYDQCSSVFISMLKYVGVMDADGNLIEAVDDVVEENMVPVDHPPSIVGDLVADTPDCFGFEDDNDPACLGCDFIDSCKEDRLKNRPECFGKMFDEFADECIICIEAKECEDSKNGTSDN